MGRPKNSKNGVQCLVENTCIVCGNVFKTYPSNKRQSCGRECYLELHTRDKKEDRKCQYCEKVFSVYSSDVKRKEKGHDVHHIDYDKKNNNPENLITLCHSCHAKTNSNREYWTKTLLERNIHK